MSEAIVSSVTLPVASFGDVMQQVLHEGAQRMLTQAIEEEIREWLEKHEHLRDAAGRRQVVRNGYLPEREILTGLGPIAVRQPRVRDRRGERAEKFQSAILPPYLRKTKNLEELIPWLYLKGVSTGAMSEALQALVGPDAAGLSATTVTRLKSVWEEEFQEWNRRSLQGKRYVYLWVDGVHCSVRLGEDDRLCLLVILGATADGRKELVAVQSGYRESEESWRSLLLELQARGLVVDPHLAIGDGALGFWKALPQVFGTTRTQRCWVHKTANVLDKLPKRLQPEAKSKLHEIYNSATRADAERVFDLFLKTYEAKYSKATDCLAKDRDTLLAFYDFPAEHWIHLRTTNPIESAFATVKLRTVRTKGAGSCKAAEVMAFKLLESAEKHWRQLNGAALLPEVIAGIKFVDGLKVAA
jgi:putative transposase